MTRKMNKQIKQIVEIANKALTNEEIYNNKDKRNMLFGFVSHILIVNNMYKGYNMFTHTEDGLKLDKDGLIYQLYT